MPFTYFIHHTVPSSGNHQSVLCVYESVLFVHLFCLDSTCDIIWCLFSSSDTSFSIIPSSSTQVVTNTPTRSTVLGKGHRWKGMKLWDLGWVHLSRHGWGWGLQTSKVPWAPLPKEATVPSLWSSHPFSASKSFNDHTWKVTRASAWPLQKPDKSGKDEGSSQI